MCKTWGQDPDGSTSKWKAGSGYGSASKWKAGSGTLIYPSLPDLDALGSELSEGSEIFQALDADPDPL
jgi:hypothetical protein